MLGRPIAVTFLALAALAAPAAADDAKCGLVRMSDPGWSDVSSTNGLFGNVLQGLGYRQKVETLAVPVTYRSMASGQIDAFLGNWMPAQKSFVEAPIADGSIKVVHENLKGIRFTLAVPDYVANAGVKSVDDLAGFGDKFRKKIYGIGAGSPINQNIQKAIEAGEYGLSGWELIESGEQAMLAQVDRAQRRKEWIAFIAWEPHPMNTKYKFTYLGGGTKTFGENYGASNVFTVARKGLTDQCPNLGRLLAQTSFTIEMENEVMAMLADGRTADAAAKDWLKTNPAVLDEWLDGVQTIDGKPGLAAVKAYLGLQ